MLWGVIGLEMIHRKCQEQRRNSIQVAVYVLDTGVGLLSRPFQHLANARRLGIPVWDTDLFFFLVS